MALEAALSNTSSSGAKGQPFFSGRGENSAPHPPALSHFPIDGRSIGMDASSEPITAASPNVSSPGILNSTKSFEVTIPGSPGSSLASCTTPDALKSSPRKSFANISMANGYTTKVPEAGSIERQCERRSTNFAAKNVRKGTGLCWRCSASRRKPNLLPNSCTP
jgi:hypothetical protein